MALDTSAVAAQRPASGDVVVACAIDSQCTFKHARRFPLRRPLVRSSRVLPLNIAFLGQPQPTGVVPDGSPTSGRRANAKTRTGPTRSAAVVSVRAPDVLRKAGRSTRTLVAPHGERGILHTTPGGAWS